MNPVTRNRLAGCLVLFVVLLGACYLVWLAPNQIISRAGNAVSQILPTLEPTATATSTMDPVEAARATVVAAEAGSTDQADSTRTPTVTPTRGPITIATATPGVQPEFDGEVAFMEFLQQRGAAMAEMVAEGDQPVAFAVTNGGLATYAVFGAPASVDPSMVLQARGRDAYGNVFTNTVGLSSQMMVAEPGSILYGPDEDPDIVRNNAHGAYFSSITQALLEGDEASINVAEGGFVWCTAGFMTVNLGDVGIRLDGVEGHNWFLMIRGLFEDGKQDSDLNRTLVFQDFKPGHAQCMMPPPGAYISEGQFLQTVELSHTGGSNCGREGCSGLSVLMFDLNTKAWTVISQSQLNAPWQFVESNWWTPSSTTTR